MISCVFSIYAFSQNAPAGKDIVKNFSTKMQNLQSLSANFTFTLENLKEKITDSHDGKIVVKGNKYYLELMGMEVYFNGSEKWQFIKEANEVTVSKPEKVEGGFFDDPTKLFKSYEKNFKSKYIGEKTVKGKELYELELYPIDLNAAYSILKLQFSKRTLEPELIKYQGKDGNNYIIKVKNFKSDIPVKDDKFIFDQKKHKNVEVVDLR